MQSRHLSRVVQRPAAEVYAFVSNPHNLHRWADGLARSELSTRGDSLVADSPTGEVVVTFVPPNEFGVVDHDVTLPSGTTVTNHFRVLTHPHGAELLFTVRQVELSDAEFERDCRMVEEDLERLARLLETQ